MAKHSSWFDGYDACVIGQALDENPECPGQPAFWAWRDGWASAQRGDLALARPVPPPTTDKD